MDSKVLKPEASLESPRKLYKMPIPRPYFTLIRSASLGLGPSPFFYRAFHVTEAQSGREPLPYTTYNHLWRPPTPFLPSPTTLALPRPLLPPDISPAMPETLLRVLYLLFPLPKRCFSLRAAVTGSLPTAFRSPLKMSPYQWGLPRQVPTLKGSFPSCTLSIYPPFCSSMHLPSSTMLHSCCLPCYNVNPSKQELCPPHSLLCPQDLDQCLIPSNCSVNMP